MSEWKLKELKIEHLNDWEQKKLGTTKEYGGKIRFSNDECESFTVNIPHDRATVIYGLVADLVAAQANELAARMQAAMSPNPISAE